MDEKQKAEAMQMARAVMKRLVETAPAPFTPGAVGEVARKPRKAARKKTAKAG